MAGRQSSSFVNDVAKADGITFIARKDGAATVAALAGHYRNGANVALVVRKVVVSAGTAPAGSALTVDVKIDGTSVFAAAGDRAKIAAGATSGSAVPTAAAKSVAPGGVVTAEVTGIGSGTAGSDVVVEVFFG